MQGRGSSAREVEEDADAMSTGRKQREWEKEAAARAAFGREREESPRDGNQRQL